METLWQVGLLKMDIYKYRKVGNLCVGLVVLCVYIWAMIGTDTSLIKLGKGIPNMVDFIGRLLPPDLSIVGRSTIKILETLQMAIVGSLLGSLIAFPLSLLAARNIVSSRVVYNCIRSLFDALRGIHELVWALIFVSMVGLGPFAGVLALTAHVTGALGRYFSEAIETVNPEVINAITSTGANKAQVIIRGVFPEVKPLVMSYYLYYLEHNFRSATVLGLVGAGGIGMELITSLRLFKYQQLSTILIMMILTIMLLDRISAYIRKKITNVGEKP